MPSPTPIYAGDATLVALGKAIRTLRKSQGISQEGLAIDIGMERSYLSGIERGMQNPTVMALQRIASALKLSLADIMRAAEI